MERAAVQIYDERDAACVAPSCLPLALAQLHGRMPVGAPLDLRALAGDHDSDALERDDVGGGGRSSSSWTTESLADVVVGAGFVVGSVEVDGEHVRVRATRARSIADTVAPGMRLLVCGLNPSEYAADRGVGYARPGNRFWPAALEAGVVTRDRDPLHALSVHGVGMTDMVKRATPASSALTAAEYRAGAQRVERLVRWLQPGAVCFVGMEGFRSAVDRRARAGVQPTPFGRRPAYLMPSTSGLNASVSRAALAAHLAAAAELAAEAGREAVR